MKQLTQYIKESIKIIKGNPFKEETQYTLSEWNEWKTSNQNDTIDVYEDINNGLVYIYRKTSANRHHIATYKIDDEILWCDDLTLFNKEK